MLLVTFVITQLVDQIVKKRLFSSPAARRLVAKFFVVDLRVIKNFPIDIELIAVKHLLHGKNESRRDLMLLLFALTVKMKVCAPDRNAPSDGKNDRRDK